jgi:hypothetical protein
LPASTTPEMAWRPVERLLGSKQDDKMPESQNNGVDFFGILNLFVVFYLFPASLTFCCHIEKLNRVTDRKYTTNSI